MAALVPHPQLGLSPQGAQAQEYTLVHDPPALWDQVHTMENVVAASVTVWQPPRKDPHMGYSMIVPQSEQKFRDILGTTPEGGVLLGPERPCTYDDLNDNNKKRFDGDDNVKMILAGFELTKEDRESQLYDEFERFQMLPGENINEYYVRFYKLINDMRNIIMTMPNI
ncbi:hypothetical protein Tco_1353233 [Tanacetum coccineum]